MLLAACGGMFGDDKANHLLSFSVFLGPGNSVVVEFMAAILVIEKAKQMNLTKLWLETDCMLIMVMAFANVHLVPWILKSRWLTYWAYTLRIDFIISHIFKKTNFYADILANIEFKGKNST